MICIRPFLRELCAALGLLAFCSPIFAQVKYPPLPDSVDVQFRYRIRADRDERVRQFRVLQAHLNDLGFERRRQADDDLDIVDPSAERFEGTMPSKNVPRLLDDPRVKTVLFKPLDFKAPDDPAQPVSLRIRIPTGYLIADQQRLHQQVVDQLERLGFRQAIGYDHRNYSLIRGDLPYANLFRLLKDLRTEPGGWFAAETPLAELPSPFRDTLPIRTVEVLAGADLAFLAPPLLPANRVKFTPDLRAILDDPAAAAKPARVEVVTDRRFEPAELELLRARLRNLYSRVVPNPVTQQLQPSFATLEGAVGHTLTIHFPRASDIEAFAGEPGVAFVRSPRGAVESNSAGAAKELPKSTAAVLADTRLGAFHALGYRGRGTKIVVIATEFGDLVPVGKNSPSPLAFIDLTEELSADLLPAPFATGDGSGGGAAAVRAARIAAPEAALVLVRVDPASYSQVYSVAKYASGVAGYSEAMQSRIAELTIRADEQRRQMITAVEEYRTAFNNLSDEEQPTLRRARAKAELEVLVAEERKLTAVIERATALQTALGALSGSTVIVNTLVWETGFAVDGLSDLSQLVDTSYASDALPIPQSRSATRPRTPDRPIWVQMASSSAGSVWGGPFLDAQGNAAMEFAPSSVPVRRDEWSRELNFLGVRAADGTISPTLPAGSKIKLTIQWRETHDSIAYGSLEATFPLSVRIFRQLDPEGKMRASDELSEVARPIGAPYRVAGGATYGVYERIVEYSVAAEGRYCAMVEGQAAFDPRLPGIRRQLEVRPRLFVEFVGAGPQNARLVFTSYAPRDVGVGIPGDAKAAIAVGDATVATAANGLTGGGPGIGLLQKPDLFAARTAGNLASSSGFVGGLLAVLVGSGAPTTEIIRATGLIRGGPAEIPAGWLKALQRR